MLVDELYTRVPVGATFYIKTGRNTTLQLIKQGLSLSLSFVVQPNNSVDPVRHYKMQPHSLVQVESDRVLITKEQYFSMFPHLLQHTP